jgi:hypothetical protein
LPQAFMLQREKVSDGGMCIEKDFWEWVRVVRVCLHEGIIDGDDEDLASILKLGVGDVARDMSVGARWA